jgi:hypothetical protein
MVTISPVACKTRICCASCMEQVQNKAINAMERKGERIRDPPNPKLPPAKKKAKQKRRYVIGKRIV